MAFPKRNVYVYRTQKTEFYIQIDAFFYFCSLVADNLLFKKTARPRHIELTLEKNTQNFLFCIAMVYIK